MNTRLATIVLTALSLAAVAGCSATRTQKTVGEQLDDTVLTMRVKTALVENPLTKARQIDVEVFRGVVQLNGFVDSAEEREQAGAAARSVGGVRDVNNNLAVGRDRSAGTAVDDAVLTARVKAALVQDSNTRGRDVNVETRGGVVQLAGFVDSSAERAAAERIARGVEGVRSVRNEIDVKDAPSTRR